MSRIRIPAICRCSATIAQNFRWVSLRQLDRFARELRSSRRRISHSERTAIVIRIEIAISKSTMKTGVRRFNFSPISGIAYPFPLMHRYGQHFSIESAALAAVSSLIFSYKIDRHLENANGQPRSTNPIGYPQAAPRSLRATRSCFGEQAIGSQERPANCSLGDTQRSHELEFTS